MGIDTRDIDLALSGGNSMQDVIAAGMGAGRWVSQMPEAYRPSLKSKPGTNAFLKRSASYSCRLLPPIRIQVLRELPGAD